MSKIKKYFSDWTLSYKYRRSVGVQYVSDTEHEHVIYEACRNIIKN